MIGDAPDPPDPRRQRMPCAETRRVAEVSFLAGSTTTAWTYDGGIAGPLITRALPPPSTSSSRRTLVPTATGRRASTAPRLSSGAHLAARLGEHQLWSGTKLTEWDHPFHLHGLFQVLDVNGVAPAVLEWKDTVNVRADATLRLLVHFDERPGMWVFHCHILDHADHGMMGMVDLR